MGCCRFKEAKYPLVSNFRCSEDCIFGGLSWGAKRLLWLSNMSGLVSFLTLMRVVTLLPVLLLAVLLLAVLLLAVLLLAVLLLPVPFDALRAGRAGRAVFEGLVDASM